MSTKEKMKIEIWSDVLCPFCYIGKKNLEKALQQINDPTTVEIEWLSYQLDPNIPQEQTDRLDYYSYLEKHKGMPRSQVEGMFEQINQMGSAVGIEFNFSSVIVANSLKAHRILQLAKSKQLSNEAEEALFKAHFTDGLDIANDDVLIDIARQVGLEDEEVVSVLNSDQFAYEVNQDIREAGNIGVKGVPFFVFNRKYGVSGAQPVEVFVETIEKALQEWKAENGGIQMKGNETGSSCDADGNCD